MMDNPIKKIITHNGSFHADDIFSCAAICILLRKKKEGFKIIRTREEGVIAEGDYVFDVGGTYNENENRFDHHQPGGAGRRENGIEYASFGLVWKKIGEELCDSAEAAKIIEEKLVSPIDAFDNGIDLFEPRRGVSPYILERVFMAMEPTWREENLDVNTMFLECVKMAEKILQREIVHARDYILAEQSAREIYRKTSDKRIIVLDKDYPAEFTVENFPDAFFVIYPRRDGTWGAKTIRLEKDSFRNRKDFPLGWAGLRYEEAARATGVPDAIFCHRSLFMAVAKSKEGAIKLAELALKNGAVQ